MSDGMHTQQDIPILLGEEEQVVRVRLKNGQSPWNNPTEKHGKLVWYAAAVGTHPEIVNIVIKRAREVVPEWS